MKTREQIEQTITLMLAAMNAGVMRDRYTLVEQAREMWSADWQNGTPQEAPASKRRCLAPELMKLAIAAYEKETQFPYNTEALEAAVLAVLYAPLTPAPGT